MTATEARAALPEILDRVAAGEEITITRHGKPVAVVLAADRVRLRRAAAERAMERARKIGERLEAARKRPLSKSPRLSQEYADELIAEIRAGRDQDPWTRSTPTP
jgi:prevent-host-death family protein